MSVSIVYNFPFESRVSHNLETGETTIYVTVGEVDPGGVVQRAMEAIRERKWVTVDSIPNYYRGVYCLSGSRYRPQAGRI